MTINIKSPNPAFNTTPADSEGYINAHWPKWEPAVQTDHIASLSRAMESSRNAWKEIAAAAKRRMRDETVTEARRIMGTAEFAEQRMKASKAVVDEAIGSAADRQVAVFRQMAKHIAPTNAAEEIRLSRLQDKIASMGEKAAQFIESAFAKGDEAVMRAVATGHAVTLGLSAEAVERYQDRYFAHVEPDLHKEHSALLEGIQRAVDYSKQLEKHVNHNVDFESAKRFKEMAA